jgi:hypothetical protein
MKSMGPILRSLVAVALIGGALPAYACVDACGGPSGRGLACVKACASASALFTQHGKLPALGKGSCHIQLRSTTSLALAGKALAAAAPCPVFLALGPAPRLAKPEAFQSADPRGPPPGSPYLWSQHPFANGPPTLL